MKKLLCLLLATCSVFCFAACEDGKCDDCKTEKGVKVYELEDGTVELCPSCAVERVGNNILGDLLG